MLAGHSKDWPEGFRIKVSLTLIPGKSFPSGKDKIAWYETMKAAWAKQRELGHGALVWLIPPSAR